MSPPRRPLIAIVGRPNVGKSTLFNRLVGSVRAIVEDAPGVTRDRHYTDALLDERPVTYVDTGGFVVDSQEDALAALVRQQAQAAIEEGTVVLFVVDGRAGITTGDLELARVLRPRREQVILVVNKADTAKVEDQIVGEFHRLGLGEPIAVAAEHARGIQDLKDVIRARLPVAPEPGEKLDDEDAPLRVAIIGRPNVGKSTLVNALAGQERSIVSAIAGTTRDPLDTVVTHRGTPIVLTDTAGIRRKSAISQRVEQFSVMGALRALEDCDVAVLVLDASEAGVEQDLKLASLAVEKGRALLIAVNKWDTQHGRMKEEDFRTGLKWELSFVNWVPMCFVSAKTGERVGKVLDLALELGAQQQFRAGTPLVDKAVKHVTTEHPMPCSKGRPLKIYYAAQVGTAPPAFAFMCNQPEDVPDRFVRYVANYLRTTFRLKVPLRLFFRPRPGGVKRARAATTFKNRAESIRRKKRR